MYFSKEFSLKVIIQILSQSIKICCYKQLEQYDFEKNAFEVL